MLKILLNFALILTTAFAIVGIAYGDEEISKNASLEKICDGEKRSQQIRIVVDTTQLEVLEYDRVSELLYFNIYKGISLDEKLRLVPSSIQGLALPMKPDQAMDVVRLYSTGIYKMEILFVPTKMKKSDKFCRHSKTTDLGVSVLRVSLLDKEGEVIQSMVTKRGRVLKAQANHEVRNYLNEGKPKVIIHVRGESLTDATVKKLTKAIKAPLTRCYHDALEKNGRYQGSIIFRFENGTTRAIHSNKNVIFGNCVTKSIEKNLPLNFEKRITLRTIFRLERK